MSSEEIEGRDLEQIREVATRFGLEVLGARRRGVMLELTPADLGVLPSASALAEIADELAGDGVRYVSLSLDSALGEEG